MAGDPTPLCPSIAGYFPHIPTGPRPTGGPVPVRTLTPRVGVRSSSRRKPCSEPGCPNNAESYTNVCGAHDRGLRR
jgi:hypothetical protein